MPLCIRRVFPTSFAMLVSPFTPTLFPPPSEGRISLVFRYSSEWFFIAFLTLAKKLFPLRQGFTVFLRAFNAGAPDFKLNRVEGPTFIIRQDQMIFARLWGPGSGFSLRG